MASVLTENLWNRKCLTFLFLRPNKLVGLWLIKGRDGRGSLLEKVKAHMSGEGKKDETTTSIKCYGNLHFDFSSEIVITANP